VVEGLIGLVRESIKKGLFQEIKIGVNLVLIISLHFADDTLFLCEDKIKNIMALKVS